MRRIGPKYDLLITKDTDMLSDPTLVNLSLGFNFWLVLGQQKVKEQLSPSM